VSAALRRSDWVPKMQGRETSQVGLGNGVGLGAGVSVGVGIAACVMAIMVLAAATAEAWIIAGSAVGVAGAHAALRKIKAPAQVDNIRFTGESPFLGLRVGSSVSRKAPRPP
jgi:hypothetical protein